jgi:hypothetical protein
MSYFQKHLTNNKKLERRERVWCDLGSSDRTPAGKIPDCYPYTRCARPASGGNSEGSAEPRITQMEHKKSRWDLSSRGPRDKRPQAYSYPFKVDLFLTSRFDPQESGVMWRLTTSGRSTSTKTQGCDSEASKFKLEKKDSRVTLDNQDSRRQDRFLATRKMT